MYPKLFIFFHCFSGSVIKHQLVTHLTLGIALRGVLDALRKPADSKVCIACSRVRFRLCLLCYLWLTFFFGQMFVFGTKAVEQFVDRLIEWPQYCNHILQISHLRSTHVELVAFIEQALLRLSAGHSDSDATAGNVEVATYLLVAFFVTMSRLYL